MGILHFRTPSMPPVVQLCACHPESDGGLMWLVSGVRLKTRFYQKNWGVPFMGVPQNEWSGWFIRKNFVNSHENGWWLGVPVFQENSKYVQERALDLSGKIVWPIESGFCKLSPTTTFGNLRIQIEKDMSDMWAMHTWNSTKYLSVCFVLA